VTPSSDCPSQSPIPINFGKCVVAVGGTALIPPQIPSLKTVPYHTNATLYNLTALPPRIAVLGGGPIGLEMAQAFALLGSKVTVVLRGPKPLPKEDPDAAAAVTAALVGDGVEFLSNCAISNVSTTQNKAGWTPERPCHDGKFPTIRIEYAGGKEKLEVDLLLVATGRKANTGGIGLEKAGVTVDPKAGGVVVVNDLLQSPSNPDVYAVGDCASKMQFTHLAGTHAQMVVDNALFGGNRKCSDLVVPCKWSEQRGLRRRAERGRRSGAERGRRSGAERGRRRCLERGRRRCFLLLSLLSLLSLLLLLLAATRKNPIHKRAPSNPVAGATFTEPEVAHVGVYGHEAEVTSVAISTELGLAVTGAANGALHIHTVAHGTFVRSVAGAMAERGAPVRALLLSSTAAQVVAAQHTAIHLFSVNGVSICRASTNGGERINAMAVTADARVLVCGGTSGVLSIRSMADLQEVQRMDQRQYGPIYSLALSAENQYIMMGMGEGRVSVCTDPQMKMDQIAEGLKRGFAGIV
jgi:thioredoxin reductase